MITFLMIVGGLVVGGGIAARSNGYRGIFSSEGKDLREEEARVFENLGTIMSLSMKKASKK